MRFFATALLVAVSTPALAAPSDDLKAVISDHWQWWLKENPVAATSLGVRDYDDKVSDISLAAQDRSAKEAQALLDRLTAIPEADLSDTERANKGVLARILSEQIEGNRFGQRTMLFTTYDNPHQSFAGLGDYVPLFTARDYRSYLARLAQFPKMNADIIAITKQAIAQGFVQLIEQGFLAYIEQLTALLNIHLSLNRIWNQGNGLYNISDQFCTLKRILAGIIQ